MAARSSAGWLLVGGVRVTPARRAEAALERAEFGYTVLTAAEPFAAAA